VRSAFTKIFRLITSRDLLLVATILLSTTEGFILLSHLEDHGLPLVQLKEQRRDLVVALMGHQQSVSSHIIMQIAAIQQTIAAIEAVITDLDAELQGVDHVGRPFLVCLETRVEHTSDQTLSSANS
jgi:hypothetical protein